MTALLSIAYRTQNIAFLAQLASGCTRFTRTLVYSLMTMHEKMLSIIGKHFLCQCE